MLYSNIFLQNVNDKSFQVFFFLLRFLPRIDSYGEIEIDTQERNKSSKDRTPTLD